MHQIFSKHSTVPDPDDHDGMDQHVKADISTAETRKPKMPGKTNEDRNPKEGITAPTPDMGEKHKAKDGTKISDGGELKGDSPENHEMEEEDPTESKDEQSADSKCTADDNEKINLVDCSVNNVAESSKKEEYDSEFSLLWNGQRDRSSKSSELGVPWEEPSSRVGTPKLPPIDSKHMSQSTSVQSSEDHMTKRSAEGHEDEVSSITSKPPEDRTKTKTAHRTAIGEDPSADTSKAHERFDAEQSKVNAGRPTDDDCVIPSVKVPSHPFKRGDSSDGTPVNSQTGSHEKGTSIVQVGPSTSNASVHTLKGMTNTSKLFIDDVPSTRSQFRPPVWVDICLQRIRQQAHKMMSSAFIISPQSKLLLLFNLLLAILGVISIMILFYQMAFSDFSKNLSWSLLGISLIYTINIFIRMHTAYYDNYGDLVCDQNTVRKKYMRRPTGLLIDVISALPVGILVLIQPESPELLRAIHKVRFGQLARFYTVFNFFRSWEGLLNAPVLLLRILRDVGFLLLLLHIWACFWYMAACPADACIEGSWIAVRELEDCSNREKYSNAVYFITATMTSTGYGEIHPNTMPEVIVCIAAIIVGKFAFGESTRIY